MENDKLIEIKNLSAGYGRVTALSDVTMTVYKGEYLAVIGPNGGGKSTLLKAVLGLLKPFGGSVTLNGVKGVGYVPQLSYADRKFPITVLEVALTGFAQKGLRPFFRYSAEQKKAALNRLDMLEIGHLADRQVGELSGGEFQKMLLSRALLSNPEVLLLDEPTANIDPASAKHIYSLLLELNKTITIIMVTHDLLAVSQGVGTLACLNKTLVYHGEPRLTPETVDELYGCPVELIAHGVPHRVLAPHSHGEEGK